MKFMMCSVCVLLATMSYAQNEEWIARYNGIGGGYDCADVIAVDALGNVYVAGASYGVGTSRDCVTLKYNSSGDTLWARYYDGGANHYDDLDDLVIDDAGNVYVTGRSIASATQYDIVTIKYDTDGVEEWVARYAGDYGDDDEGVAIAVDDNGNVYVFGNTYDLSTSNNYITIKYDSDGDTVWTRIYDGPDNSSELAHDIALDDAGNAYVTGYGYTSAGYLDYLTVKYDTAGVEQWVDYYDGTDNNATDEAYDIEVKGGYVYVTGESEGLGTDEDYLTIKYTTDGDTVWTARYHNPGGSYDMAYALAVDANDYVYVTGRSSGVVNDYLTIKYDSDGDTLWTARYNGPDNEGDQASAIAVDDLGNVYVTGWSYAYGTYTPENDYLTIKYDPSGTELWTSRYNGTGNTQDYAHAITVDNAGYVYVTGESIGDGGYEDIVTIKYATTGIEENTGYTARESSVALTAAPNPFTSRTEIRFIATESEPFTRTITIHDAAGRLVRSFHAAHEATGYGHIIWDGTDDLGERLSNGIYFVTAYADEYRMIEKVLLVR